MGTKSKNAKKKTVTKSNATKKSNDKNKVILVSTIAAVVLLAIVLLCVSVFSGPKVVIEVENFGKIVVKLDPDAAPITVENFLNLVESGFYTDSSFHRIADGFVIQGGMSATGKQATPIKGEFRLNGIENPLKHERGVISMARTNDPDSASSQFFIVLETTANNTGALDGRYAAFGRVTRGMKVVDKIAAVRTSGETPLEEIRITRAYVK